MPKLSEAMKVIGDVFDKHAGKDGNPQMSKKELAELLRVEFPEVGSDKAAAENFFTMLDGDGDGVIDFTEFVTFVTALTVILKK